MEKNKSLSAKQRDELKDLINKPKSTKNEVRSAQAILLLDNEIPDYWIAWPPYQGYVQSRL